MYPSITNLPLNTIAQEQQIGPQATEKNPEDISVNKTQDS